MTFVHSLLTIQKIKVLNEFLNINLDYKNRLEEVLINGANYPEFVFKESFNTYFMYESPILNNRDLVFNLCLLTRKLLNDEVYFSFGQLESKEYGQYKIDGTDEESIEARVDFLNAEHWNYFGQYPLVISNSNINWLVWDEHMLCTDFNIVINVFKEFFETGNVSYDMLSE